MIRPDRTRSLARFDDDSYGVIILGDKLRTDAQILRQAADFLTRLPATEQHVGALRSMAFQYDQAANGEEPQAP